MPASRRARAMIFAPRSWPSRPGFAMTTRIAPGTWAEYRGAPDRHRLLAGMAEPGERTLRIHARSRREPGAPRLRARRPRPAPRERPLAGGRRDRDHALPPRPLGRPRPLGLGKLLPLVERAHSEAGVVGAAGRRGVSGRARRATWVPGHVRAHVRAVGVRARPAVRDRQPGRDADARPALHAADLRLPRAGERSSADVLGRLGPVGGARPVGA